MATTVAMEKSAMNVCSINDRLGRAGWRQDAEICSKIVELMPRNRSHRTELFAAAAALAVAFACAPKPATRDLRGEWDAYVADGSTARPGFEGWRRMGFAHFATGD